MGDGCEANSIASWMVLKIAPQHGQASVSERANERTSEQVHSQQTHNKICRADKLLSRCDDPLAVSWQEMCDHMFWSIRTRDIYTMRLIFWLVYLAIPVLCSFFNSSSTAFFLVYYIVCYSNYWWTSIFYGASMKMLCRLKDLWGKLMQSIKFPIILWCK